MGRDGDGMRIGELARRTGISVRMLHHYDQIGLLTPSSRTEAAHRRYSAQDIARLQQIQSLRSLGFSLQEIKACLRDPAFSPERVVALHLEALRTQQAQVRELIIRLERLAHRLENAREVAQDEFLAIVEGITNMEKLEKYITPELRAEVAARHARFGQERLTAIGQERDQLLAEVQAAMDAGIDPASPQVQALAPRLAVLFREAIEDYPAIAAFAHALASDPELVKQFGASPDFGAQIHALIGDEAEARGPAQTGSGPSPALRQYLHRIIAAGPNFPH